MNHEVQIAALAAEGQGPNTKPVMAYAVAGQPLCMHLLERIAARVDRSLKIRIQDPWFSTAPELLSEMCRFGAVDVGPGGAGAVDFPLVNGEMQRVETVWDVLAVAAEILAHMKSAISPRARVEPDVEISGNVVVEEGARVLSGARLKGNVYVGPGSTIGNGALIRGDTSLGKNALVGFNAEIKTSVMLDDVIVGPTSAVPDSILEDRVFLGGLVRISNTNFQFRPVTVRGANGYVDSGRKYLGAFVGADASIAGGVRVSPGRIVGARSEVGPGVIVSAEVPPDTRANLRQDVVYASRTAPVGRDR